MILPPHSLKHTHEMVTGGIRIKLETWPLTSHISGPGSRRRSCFSCGCFLAFISAVSLSRRSVCSWSLFMASVRTVTLSHICIFSLLFLKHLLCLGPVFDGYRSAPSPRPLCMPCTGPPGRRQAGHDPLGTYTEPSTHNTLLCRGGARRGPYVTLHRL